MNQTVISAVVLDLFVDQPPYQAPNGLIWEKVPDEYDSSTNIIWEGNWELVSPKKIQNEYLGEKEQKKSLFNDWKYDDHGVYSKEKIAKKQRETIAKTLDPSYHVCDHKTHESCTGSPCCDWIWHDGNCHFVSDDGECGLAIRLNGDQ